MQIKQFVTLNKGGGHKKPRLCRLHKRIIAGISALAMVLSGMQVMPDNVLNVNWAVTASAAESTPCGSFTVMGGTSNTDYKYESNLLTILTDTPLTISGTSTADRIEVADGVNANITLDNVRIELNSNPWDKAAFKIADNSTGDVTVTLVGENTLKSSTNCAGLQKYGASENVGTLTITGTGSLTATGGDYGAGIGGGGQGQGKNNSTRNITISGGTVTATGDSGGAGIGGGSSGSGTGIIIQGTAIVTASGVAGAGIGGGSNGSGTVTITGDAHVTATITGGGAGIGGGQENSYSGSVNGDVTISGGTVIATSYNGAGIGGGQMRDGKVTISGNCNVTATATSNSAGIGGGGFGGNGTVTINGGTINATGKGNGAGIGGGSKGNGTVTITGGTVTATSSSWAASIGGGKDNNGGMVTISGGIVTATGRDIGDGGSNGSGCTFSTEPNGNAWIVASGKTVGISDTSGSDNWSGVIFQNGAGQVYRNSYTLTGDAEIPSGATLTVPSDISLTIGSDAALTNNGTITNNGGTVTIKRGGSITGGTINGSGTFQTENLTENDIVVPKDLVYNGLNQSDTVKKKLTLNAIICGQAFGVTGWTPSNVEPVDGSKSNYAVTYTPTSGGDAVTKTITLWKSDTTLTAELSDSKTEYAYSDTITINAAVSPTGTAPTVESANLRLRGEPTPGQVAVYEGDTQVCAAVTPDEKGACQFTIPAKDLGSGEHSLTVKFIETDAMAGAALTVTVTVNPCSHKTVENGACTLCGLEISAFGAVVNEVSATLDGDIGMNYYIDLPQFVVDDTDAYVQFTANGELTKIMVNSISIEADGTYKFTYRMNAKEMHDKVTFAVYDGSGNLVDLYSNAGDKIEGTGFEYSLAEYFDALSSDTSGENAALVDLAKATLAYGSYAQKALKYNVDTASNTSDLSGVTVETLENHKMIKTGEIPEGLKLSEMTLILETKTTLRLYFKADDISKYSFMLDSAKAVLTEIPDEGLYYIEVPDISAKDLSIVHTLEVGDYSLTFSALSYAYSTLKENKNVDLCNAVKALYKYNEAANAYFNN